MTRDERILSLATKGGCGQSVSLSFQRILLKLAMAMDSPARVSRRIARSWYPPSLPSGGISPLGPRTSLTTWFQALFTSLPGYFSAFRHRTGALSVLGRI